VNRHLVLFAREPARQAREKGLESPGAAGLFREFAAGWLKAAQRIGARLIVATPPEDLPRWRRALPPAQDLGWMDQRGGTLGERLEDAARRAAALGGQAVLVGGDVSPSKSALENAFEALEAGADAAVAPALDGGVSLLALPARDFDLLRGIRRRSRTVLRDLVGALKRRGRRVEIIAPAADVDGPRSLRALLRRLPAGAALRALVRSLLCLQPRMEPFPVLPARPRALASPSGLRAPPAPAPA
jgi:glycosyltransferase A (GT-A) superfamily protein (DUF2064 family)